MVAFPDKLVFFITDIILYILAAYHIFLYYRTRRTIIRRFPDYYSSIFTYRYLKGPEPFYYKYESLVIRSRARNTSLTKEFWILGLITVVGGIVFKVKLISLGLVLFWSSMSRTKRLVQPPIALFLSTSNENSIKLFRLLYMLFMPEKITCLLDLPMGNHPLDRSILSDYLRTKDDALWKETIHELYKLCDYIVVDSRGDSIAVQYELDTIHQRELWHKTLIVTDDGLDESAYDNFCERTNYIHHEYMFKGSLVDMIHCIRPNYPQQLIQKFTA